MDSGSLKWLRPRHRHSRRFLPLRCYRRGFQLSRHFPRNLRSHRSPRRFRLNHLRHRYRRRRCFPLAHRRVRRCHQRRAHHRWRPRHRRQRLHRRWRHRRRPPAPAPPLAPPPPPPPPAPAPLLAPPPPPAAPDASCRLLPRIELHPRAAMANPTAASVDAEPRTTSCALRAAFPARGRPGSRHPMTLACR